jgi:hypothetical protein
MRRIAVLWVRYEANGHAVARSGGVAMAGVVAFDAGRLQEAGAFVCGGHMLYIDKNNSIIDIKIV